MDELPVLPDTHADYQSRTSLLWPLTGRRRKRPKRRHRKEDSLPLRHRAG